MTDDIVARLRVWSRWLGERVPDSDVEEDIREAADEIERLQRDYSCICGEMRRMMEERDQARREVCAYVSGHYSKDVVTLDRDAAIAEAKRRCWDCFKEASDGRG